MRQTRRCLLFLSLAGAAWADAAVGGTLKDIRYEALPGGRVELRLSFDQGVPPARFFTTDNPPRIAVDFAATGDAAAHHIAIGQGATDGVSTIAAGGRTRVVVELARASTYRSRVDGDSLVLTVENGTEARTTTTAATIDPSKALPSAMAAASTVSNIDFHRGPNGEGRLLVDFSGSGANAELRRGTGGDTVVVDLEHVSLPASLARRLDVTDFATPVQSITAKPSGRGGARLVLAVKGKVETSAYQTPGQYVLEVAPGKADARDAAPAAKSGQDPVYTGNRVTFNFQDIPVRSALQLLADISGLNLVASDSVGGSVTLRLVNVPWDQALDVVLRAKSLDQRRNGNVIWIAPQKELADYEQSVADARLKAEDNAELISVHIPISYGKAADLARLLTRGSLQAGGSGGGGGGSSGSATHGFLSPRGSASYDDRTNTLLINDTPQKIQELRDLVATLDKPVRQVLIESRIVIATDNFTRELGAKFGVSASHQNTGNTISAGGSLVTDATTGAVTGAGGLSFNLPATTAGAGSFAVAVLGKSYALDLELSAAQTEGRSELISTPRAVVANNQEADIRQGQEIGYVTYQNSTSSSVGSGTATVQFKDAVLELKVTPTITADNRVYLKVTVNKDSLNKFIDVPGNGQVPIIDTNSMNTSVLIDNGQTVVLGGIYEFDKINSTTKVPGLGDIPVLGALFRNNSRQSNKGELLIFVTPRILSDTAQ